MSKRITSTFILLLFAWSVDSRLEAAPAFPPPPDSFQEADSSNNDLQQFIIVEPQKSPPQLHTTVKTKNADRPSYFYYQQSLSAKLGLFFKDDFSTTKNPGWLMGFSYMFPSNLSPHWEAGVDFLSSGLGFIYLSRKITYRQRQPYRPYLALGLGHLIQSSQQFAGFSNFDNYLIRGALGFEDLIKNQSSFRGELELGLGAEEQRLSLSFGYSLGW